MQHSSQLKKVCIVSPHFPPSNLVGVHRARLLGNHLNEHGWEPTILTVAPEFYEEKLDERLLSLVNPDVRVVHVGAISQKIARPLGFGDIGLRGFHGMLRKLYEMSLRNEFDLLFITIPSNYAALLGRALFSMKKIAYAIDYQDPWVNESDFQEAFLSKAGITQCLAKNLEPLAVSRASGISGMTPAYFKGVIERNHHLEVIPHRAFQMGFAMQDYQMVKKLNIHPTRLPSDPNREWFTLIYAGALLPKAVQPMKLLLKAIDTVNHGEKVSRKLRLICIGTGSSPDDIKGHRILPLAREMAAENWVTEYPQRHSFLEVLATLQKADGVAVVGSEEKHYSPSKIFQALGSEKPVFAMLHRESEALKVIEKTGGCVPVPMESDEDPGAVVEKCVRSLEWMIGRQINPLNTVELAKYDVSNLSKTVAEYFSECVEYFQKSYN